MKRKIEEKDSQAVIGKRRSTMDHLTKSELKKKGRRMCALFVDFRAAFDKIDRDKIFECMREYRRLRRYTQEQKTK
jgi:hypothetical protein